MMVTTRAMAADSAVATKVLFIIIDSTRFRPPWDTYHGLSRHTLPFIHRGKSVDDVCEFGARDVVEVGSGAGRHPLSVRQIRMVGGHPTPLSSGLVAARLVGGAVNGTRGTAPRERIPRLAHDSPHHTIQAHLFD
jgi:hypothetical protein